MEKNGTIFFLSLPVWSSGSWTRCSFRKKKCKISEWKQILTFILQIDFKEEDLKFYASLFSCTIVRFFCCFLFLPSTAPAAQFLYCLSPKKCFGLVCNFCSAVELLEPFWQCNILLKWREGYSFMFNWNVILQYYPVVASKAEELLFACAALLHLLCI